MTGARIQAFVVVVIAWLSLTRTASAFVSEDLEPAVARLREYLRIETAHPCPDYLPVTKFLIQQAQSIGIDSKILEFAQGKHLVLMTWVGSEPQLSSVLLNSHTDVAPAEASKWTYHPFSAHLDGSGNIFARGSQDTKSVGMQYLEATRNLMAAGFEPQRTIHFSYVPDEEIGGEDGAKAFMDSHDFEELDVAVVLDEGVASSGDDYRVFNREKIVWSFFIKATGDPRHGSRLFDGMASENLQEALQRIGRFRETQMEMIKNGLVEEEGEVVSINNVYLKAGTATPRDTGVESGSQTAWIHVRERVLDYAQEFGKNSKSYVLCIGQGFVMNLQPSEAEAGFDMRLPPEADAEAMERILVEEWAPASSNLTYQFILKQQARNNFGEPAVTAIDDSNSWWMLLREAVTRAGGKLRSPEIRTGVTDARYARYKGIPAFGFSPMANTPSLMHDHNEFLNVKEYLKGIKVYEEIIKDFTGAKQDTGIAHRTDTAQEICKMMQTALDDESSL